MAFQQPLVPVLPVARELFSKTKLIASKGATQLNPRPSANPGKRTTTDDTIRDRRPRRSSSSGIVPPEVSDPIETVFKIPVTEEPESTSEEFVNNDSGSSHRRGRGRLLSIFGKRIPPGSPHRPNVSVSVVMVDTIPDILQSESGSSDGPLKAPADSHP